MVWLDASIPSATACSSSRCPAAASSWRCWAVRAARRWSSSCRLRWSSARSMTSARQASSCCCHCHSGWLRAWRMADCRAWSSWGSQAPPRARASARATWAGSVLREPEASLGAAAGPPGGSQCRTGRPQIPPSALISSTAIWARFPVAAANTLPGPDLPVGLPSGWLSAGSSSAPTNHAVASATAGPRPSAPRPVLFRHLCLGQFEGCPVRDEGDVLVHRVQRLGAGEKHGERLVVCEPVQPRSDLL